MLDYSFGEDEGFIKYYEKDGRRLRVHFANKTRYMKNTLGNKRKLDNRMRMQVNVYDVERLQEKLNIKKHLLASIFLLPLMIIDVYILSDINVVNIGTTFLFTTPFIVPLSYICRNIVLKKEMKTIKNLEIDLEKSGLFNAYEEELNDGIKSEELIGLKEKTKEVIMEEQPLTLNQLERIKLTEFKILLENIEYNRAFSSGKVNSGRRQ